MEVDKGGAYRVMIIKSYTLVSFYLPALSLETVFTKGVSVWDLYVTFTLPDTTSEWSLSNQLFVEVYNATFPFGI